MHEAGLAASIIEIAEAEARKREAIAVRSVRLRLGEFTGVVAEALDFAFEALKRGTLLEDAVLEVERIPLVGSCPDCLWVGRPAEDFCLVCAHCGSPVEILTGREMAVESIEIEESNACALRTR